MADPYANLGVVANDPYSTIAAPVKAPTPKKRAGATGVGMIGETIGALVNPESTRGRNPNALEQGIMDLADNPIVKGARGTFKQAATSGLIAQPTRAVMQGMGVGMDDLKRKYPGRSEQWYKDKLNQSYSQAVRQARADATREADEAKIVPKIDTIEEVVAGKAKATLPERGARLVQQGVNLGANVVANPHYFLIPGMSFGGNAATRIGTAAGVEAGVGGLSDAAAQVMDIATETKKDFDVQQNLEATLVSGAFGGGMRGTIEVAPFVKDLFKQRGMDTTPQADPRTSKITPMTQDHVPMNQADAMQYKQLLETGSVDDIKGFFQGRNGPQPKWQDVAIWVQHRDAQVPNAQTVKPDFDYEAEYNKHAEQQYAEQNRVAVEEHVTGLTSGWKNAPELEVTARPEFIQDPEIRAQALKEDAAGDALGFLGSDGKIRIFSERIPDADTANAVLFHEGLGHFGLAQKFGDRLDQTISSLLDRNVSQFARHVDEWQKKNPKAYGGDRIRAAEEVLAEYSQNGQIKKSWQDALNASIRQFGRKMGLKLAYSDAEIKHILAMAHDAVINGKPSVAANGFRGAMPDPENPNRFMFIGQKAQNFDPEKAFTTKDGQLRNEIDDRMAKFRPVLPDTDLSKLTLSQLLKHPELFEQYPQLRDLPVKLEKLQDELGYYDSDNPHIGLDPDSELGVLLHEVQHAIQDIEGQMKTGDGTAHMTEADYHSDPREIEAELTRERQGMDPYERIAKPVAYMKKSQLASEPDYVAHDLEGIYKALDEGYTKTTRSFEEERRAALELGFNPSQIKDLKERNPGELSTRLYRMQAAANMADMKIAELNKKLDTPDWSIADQQQYLKVLADRNYLVSRIKGERSELGRALNVSKAASSYHNATMEEVAKLLEEQGSGLANLTDPTTFLKFARQVQQMMNNGNPQGARILMQAVNKPYWEQYLNTFHMNMMLSGVSTQFKAAIDTATGIEREVIEKVVAMPIGALRRLAGAAFGKKTEVGVHPEEVAAHMYGMLKAVTEAEVYRRTFHAAKTGEGAYVNPNGSATPINFMNQYGAVSNPRIPLLSKPSDLLAAQDTFFRSVMVNQNLYALGTREARSQLGPKASWDDVMTLGSNLARNPTKTMLDEALDLSSRNMLMNHSQLNDMLEAGRTYRPGLTAWERAGRFVMYNLAPFIRVEANSLMNRVIQRSPLGFLDPYTQSQLKAGGAKADIAMAKILYGTLLIGSYWVAADPAKDLLQGRGPDNPDKNKEKQAGGFSPMSVHEDGQYKSANALPLSMNPFDKRNAVAATVAGLRQAYEKGANEGQVGTGLKLALGSLLHGLADMSWIGTMAPAMAAASATGEQGESKVEKFVGEHAKSWMPNLVHQAARMQDGVKRDTRPEEEDSITGRVINELKSTIPGMREELPAKYSVYGRPLEQGTSLTGIHNATSETDDPAEQELQRLAGLTKAAIITPVEKTLQPPEDVLEALYDSGQTDLKIEDDKIKLTPAQFQEYQRVAGRAIVETVREEMSTPEWQAMSDDERVLTVREIQTDMKKLAREALFYGQE